MSLARDLRHAGRSIVRMPLLAAVVIGSLGVGIGVNTTVFSWIQGLVLSPIPGVQNSGAIRLIEPRSDDGGYPGVSWTEYEDLAANLDAFRALIASEAVPFNVGTAGQSERAYGMLVSANYFDVLGLEPALGRFFTPEEAAAPGSAPVAVISHDFWRTHLAQAPDVLGRILRVNAQPITIVGVAPGGFQGTVTMLTFDMWVPATMAPVLFNGSTQLTDRNSRGFAVLGVLAAGVTQKAAQRELDQEMAGLAKLYPASNAGVGGEVLAFSDAPRGPQRFLVRALTVLQGIMVLLLLAVCGNTANLLLARASARRREIGVRLALGSGAWRVGRLLVMENLILGLAGAGVGAAIAVWGTQALRDVPMIGAFPIRFQTSIDLTGLGFAMLLGLFCGLIFGSAPALQLIGLSPQDMLRGGASSRPRGGLGNVLMGVEVALATAILVAAGAFLQSFRSSQETDPGFRREGVLLAAYDLTGEVTDSVFVRDFTGTLLDRLQAIPGVQAAAIAASVPLDIHGLPRRSFTVEGRARSDDTRDEALSNLVTPGYFAVMGIPLEAGSDFASFDDAGASPQVIVNQAFVQEYLDGREPLGRRLEANERSYTIVGIARTTVSDAFGEPPTPVIYFSYRDRPPARGEIHVRTAPGAEQALAERVRRVVRELDPMLSVYDVRTLAEHVDKNLFIQRIPAQMFVVLGPLILALAAIGIYAVVAYAVTQRRAEIGIRMALGATSSKIVTQVVSESMQVIVFGTLAGALVASGVGRGLSSGAIAPPIVIGAPLLLLLVAVVSCWVPASRAATVDPLIALRQD